MLFKSARDLPISESYSSEYAIAWVGVTVSNKERSDWKKEGGWEESPKKQLAGK